MSPFCASPPPLFTISVIFERSRSRQPEMRHGGFETEADDWRWERRHSTDDIYTEAQLPNAVADMTLRYGNDPSMRSVRFRRHNVTEEGTPIEATIEIREVSS